MTRENQPVRVYEHVAYFRIVSVPRKWGRLERLTFPPQARDDLWRWLGQYRWSQLDGVQVEVRLSVYAAGRQLFVGGVEVVTVPEPWEIPHVGEINPPTVAPLAIGTDIIRAVPLGELTQEAIREAQDMDVARTALSDDKDREAFERLRTITSTNEEAKPKRGRPSPLTPELLELVSNTYLRAGRTGVQAVQQALQEAGFPGATAAGVTRDQAAKAVATARRKGFLPPARRNTPKEETK